MTAYEPLAVVKPGPYRLRVADFLLLDAAGSFDGHGRTELLAGEIYCMNAQHRPHGRIKMRLYDALRAALDGHRSGLAVVVEVSVALSDHDAPEPDLTLTDQPDGDGLVPGNSVALVVEVSDSTIGIDRGRKAALYAAAAVPEYWVIDINARVIHQLSQPTDGRYTIDGESAFGSPVTARTIPGLTIDTGAL